MNAQKIRRKELLKTEDEFLSLSARAVLFVREHSRLFQMAGVVVAAVILVYLGVYTYMNYVDRAGQAAYNEAYYALGGGFYGKSDPEKIKRLDELFRKVTDQYSRSKVSRLAYPELGHLKYQEKNYGEAISLYERYLEELSASSPYRPLALLALAGCYEEKGEMAKALEILQRSLSLPHDAFRELAMLNLARVYRLQGQESKAKETLKEFAAKFKESSFLPLVRAQLNKEAS